MRNTKWIYPSIMVLALAWMAGVLPAADQGTSAFTYQGRLTDNGVPANGPYTLQFTLQSSETGNNPVGGPLTVTTNIVNGLFTTDLDFGEAAFNGEQRWLELSVAPASFGPAAPVSGVGQAKANNATTLSRAPIRVVPQASYTRRAMTAVTADTATNAVTAQRAQVAVTAETATNAVFATKAQVAVTAQAADTATVATNAQLLNGMGAAAFAPASGSTAYVAKGGDTMTGPLNLPANGLNVGNQLVVSGGNVGIGIVSPASPLHVNGRITTGVDFGSAGAITLRPPDGWAYFHMDNGPSGGRPIGRLRFSYGANPGDFEVISMTQEGLVGIGTTTPTHSLTISNSAGNGLRLIGSGGGDLGFGAKLNIGDGDFVYLHEYADDLLRVQANRVGVGRDAAANRLEVEGEASKTTAGGWLANSDRRIKQDIQPVGQALETLDKVRPVSFRYSEDYRAEHSSVENRRYLNVVAQEFREVFPDHVKSSGEKLPNGEEILQVDTYPLTLYSVAAIQELNRKVEQKQTEIMELRQKMNELKALVEAMNHKLNGGAK